MRPTRTNFAAYSNGAALNLGSTAIFGWRQDRWNGPTVGTYSLLTGVKTPYPGLTTAVRYTLGTSPAWNGKGYHLGVNPEAGTIAAGAGFPVTAGETITVSCLLRRNAPGITSMQAGFRIRPASDTAWLGTGDTNGPNSVIIGEWVLVSQTYVVPATATQIGAYVTVKGSVGTSAQGDTLDGTALLLERASGVREWFDGNTPDSALWDHAWRAAVNASVSDQFLRLDPAPPLPPLRRASRPEYYRVDLMTNRDGTIGQLDGVSGVSLEFSSSDDGVLTSGGSLNLNDRGQTIDWLNARCQPWASINGEEWPLGVYLLSAPTTQHAPTGRSWNVTLKDKLSILDEDVMAETYALNAGQNVVDAIRQVIADAGEANHAISADPRVLASPMTWPVNTSRLTIVQDLLKMLNYAPLRVDGWGAYVGEPFVDPQNRPVTEAFEEGVDAIHLPTFQVTKDVASIPNRLIGVSSSSTVGLVVTADNTDPTSPYSIPARNRVIARSEDFDATDISTLAALVSRRMLELMAPGSVVQFQHAVVPLAVDSVVRFTSDGVSLDGVVLSTSVTLEAGQMMQTTIQEVVRADLSVS